MSRSGPIKKNMNELNQSMEMTMCHSESRDVIVIVFSDRLQSHFGATTFTTT